MCYLRINGRNGVRETATPCLRILKQEQQKGTREMKRAGRIGFICLLAALLLCQTAYAADADVSSMTLNQVRQKAGELTMYVNLYDATGYPVMGTYSPEQFAVSVDGVGASVESVSSYDPAAQGIHYVFVIDVSKTMTDAMMQSVHAALNAYVDKMGPNDTVTVITFGEWVTELLSDCGDKEQVKQTISGIVPNQYWTALYEGVLTAARAAAGGRSAVIVITDGKNEVPDPNAPPTKEDIITQLQTAQAPLYCIGLNDNNGVNRDSLVELANVTGGAEFDGPASNIGASLDQIYGIVCGAIELHATMTNPEGKSSFNEPSTFLVGFETEDNFITSNELQQIVNWTRVPGPEALATPVPTSRPQVTPPPASDPPALPPAEPEPEPESASTPLSWLIVAGVVVLIGVLATLLFVVGKGRKKRGDPPLNEDEPSKAELSGEPTVAELDRRFEEYKTVYDGAFRFGKGQEETTDTDGASDFVNVGAQYASADETEATVFLGQNADKTVYLGAAAAGNGRRTQNSEKRGISVSVEEERAGQRTADPRTLYLREGDAVVFGRIFPADVVIRDEAVSKIHVRLSFDGEALAVCDLDTTNGTRVNGEKLEKTEQRRLQDGDVVKLGTTSLTFRFGAPGWSN